MGDAGYAEQENENQAHMDPERSLPPRPTLVEAYDKVEFLTGPLRNLPP